MSENTGMVAMATQLIPDNGPLSSPPICVQLLSSYIYMKVVNV